MSEHHMRVGVIGVGRLGTTLLNALRGLDLKVAPIDRHLMRTERKRQEHVLGCDVLIVAVADDDVAHLVGVLGSDQYAGRLVSCSGGFMISDLREACPTAVGVGKLHPLSSFVTASDTPFSGGTHFALGGDPALVDIMASWVERWDGVVHCLEDDDWMRYHAAAVLAANFLPLLIRGGSGLLSTLGTDERESIAWLTPLVQASVAYGLDPQVAEPYSGPAIRGDDDMIAKHIAELRRWAPGWVETYKVLTDRMRKMRR